MVAMRQDAITMITRADERRASMYQGDGVLDVGVGLCLMLAGLVLLVGVTAVAPVLWVLIAFLAWLGVRWAKASLITPRMRAVDFRPSAEAMQLHTQVTYATLFGVLALLATGALLAFVLYALALSGFELGRTASNVIGAVLGLIVVAGLAVIGRVTDARRFLLYAGLAVAAGVLALAGVPFAWALALLGALVLICGIVMLIVFVRQHPRA